MTGAALRLPLETLSLYPPHDDTVAGLLASRACPNPARPFLVYQGVVRSYGETEDLVVRAAKRLTSQGVVRGDRVAVLAPNSDEYVLLFFALARIGAILVPINPEFGVAEV